MLSTEISNCLRSASRTASIRPINLRAAIAFKPSYSVRPITCSTKLYDEDKRTPSVAERALDPHDDHHGSFSRTDRRIQLEHPEDEHYPQGGHYSGSGGMHFKRTLASFTLDKRTVVITGGARGLGLVMSQACLLSGANVALVDLNSEDTSIYWKAETLTVV